MDKKKLSFAFTRKNYILMLIGLGIVVLGYFLMSGGGSPDPRQFDPSIFSARRITVAPIVVILGYIFIGYAIMYRESQGNQSK